MQELAVPLHVLAAYSCDPTHCAGQSPSGSVPPFVTRQSPSAPAVLFAAEHDMQAPVHADSQHTPSTQNPETHEEAVAHESPSALPFTRTHAAPGVKLENELVFRSGAPTTSEVPSRATPP